MEIKTQAIRSGWSMAAWCDAVGITRNCYYTLPVRPEDVKLGRRRIVREAPDLYLARVAQAQAEAAS